MGRTKSEFLLAMRRRLYVASRTEHAELWQRLRTEWSRHVEIVSTWIDEAGPGESPDLCDLWRRCISEASWADAVLVYAQPGDVLTGALLEVGAALALGTPVFVVGECDQFSRPSGFLNHPGVTRCACLTDARQAVELLPAREKRLRITEHSNRGVDQTDTEFKPPRAGKW